MTDLPFKEKERLFIHKISLLKSFDLNVHQSLLEAANCVSFLLGSEKLAIDLARHYEIDFSFHFKSYKNDLEIATIATLGNVDINTLPLMSYQEFIEANTLKSGGKYINVKELIDLYRNGLGGTHLKLLSKKEKIQALKNMHSIVTLEDNPQKKAFDSRMRLITKSVLNALESLQNLI